MTVSVENRDAAATAIPLVNEFTLVRNMFVSGETLNITLTGQLDSDDLLELSIQVICADGFTGPNCVSPGKHMVACCVCIIYSYEEAVVVVC